MDKVHLEISGSFAILTLANPVERPPAALWFRSLPAGVAALVEYGARTFRDKVVFQGR